MADITSLILDDHETMRRAFAELDEPEPDPGRLADRWASLAQLLKVHADVGEEFLALKRDRPDAGNALADKDPDRYIAEHGDG